MHFNLEFSVTFYLEISVGYYLGYSVGNLILRLVSRSKASKQRKENTCSAEKKSVAREANTQIN